MSAIPQHPLLIVLLALWAGLLFGGFVFSRLTARRTRRTRRMPRWMRMASSLVLTIAGWSWASLARGTALSAYAALIATGMTLGLLGDLCMARLLPVKQPVLSGIGAFGLGHVVYIAAMLIVSRELGLNTSSVRLGAWLISLAVGVAGWYGAVYREARLGPATLRRAALPYALLLASTAGLASGMALQNSAFAPLAVGAVLFLISDLILAGHLFSGLNFPMVDDVIWLTYGPGQMLIVYSIAAAL